MSDVYAYIQRLQAELERMKSRIEHLEAYDKPQIVARFHSHGGQSINTATPTVLNYEHVDQDPMGSVTVGASWSYSTPVAGYYGVRGSVLMGQYSGWALNESLILQVSVSGGDTRNLGFEFNFSSTSGGSPVAQFTHVGGMEVFKCGKGASIQYVLSHTAGATLTTYTGGSDSSYNYGAIWYIGL